MFSVCAFCCTVSVLFLYCLAQSSIVLYCFSIVIGNVPVLSMYVISNATFLDRKCMYVV